ncbi:DUF4236 domain-containing protein [Stieleria tagensis]|uniref:DUF4236 domain-containing protein n=1 Tax=Stieleria tagensis TaxID=2956795 RepID=UPI00209B5BE1|nr:DUF4236 domain-containing protein [Stieleria tagensis]
MGFRFGKRKKFGPINVGISVSRRGVTVGSSIGTKNVRVGANSRGRVRLSAGARGVRYETSTTIGGGLKRGDGSASIDTRSATDLSAVAKGCAGCVLLVLGLPIGLFLLTAFIAAISDAIDTGSNSAPQARKIQIASRLPQSSGGDLSDGAVVLSKSDQQSQAVRMEQHAQQLALYDQQKAAREATENELQIVEAAIAAFKEPTQPTFERRTWHTFDRKHEVEATFVGIKDHTVQLKRTDSDKVISIDDTSLIAEDRVYITIIAKPLADAYIREHEKYLTDKQRLVEKREAVKAKLVSM